MIPPANEYKVTDTYTAEEAMERLRAFVARRPSYPDHAVIGKVGDAEVSLGTFARNGIARKTASGQGDRLRSSRCRRRCRM